MNAIIIDKQNDLSEICRRHGVKRLEVFGSASGEDFDESRSDLDLLVEFAPCDGTCHYENYFGLIEDLERLFERPVDLVESHVIGNPYFQESVDKTRETIYAPPATIRIEGG